MSDLPTRDRIELEVTDFGPIVEANIELRPLTVFVGPSNTGKSWLAILIYALHRYFSGSQPSRSRKPLQVETVNALVEWVYRVTSDPYNSSDFDFLPDAIATEVRSELNEQGNQLCSEIGRAFGIEQFGALIRKEKRDRADVTIRRFFRNDLSPLKHKLTFGAHEAKLNIEIPEKIEITLEPDDEFHFRIEHVSENFKFDDSEEYDMDLFYDTLHHWKNVFEEIIRRSLPYMFSHLYLPAFYLPADRTGVMHAHSAIVSAMIGNAPMTGLRPTARTPMLSGVLADFLQQLISIDYPKYMQRESYRREQIELVKNIEKMIIGGTVNVDRSELIHYPRFTYSPEGWKDALPLMNTSSMVSELVPVVLYLRHMVGPDNVLIIEEPESHLHPGMQVKFIRLLAAVVNSGVRVIITTHSEWVLDELANIVMSSDLTETSRQGIVGADVALRPDQVGAWLFEPKHRPKGSTVRELKLDDVTGLYPTDYDEVSETLYNKNIKIFNRIQDGKEE